MVPMRDAGIVETSHEPPPHPVPLPLRGGEGARRAGEGWFMVPMRDSGIVETSHELYPLIPSFSPSGGEGARRARSEEHTSELQSRLHLLCRLLLEKKKKR